MNWLKRICYFIGIGHPCFKCPDCNGAEFLSGPAGGMCINFACVNCWARFNDAAVMGIDREGVVRESDRHLFRRHWVPRSLKKGRGWDDGL